ncbi:uncharacterized protein LOC131254316 [Magnolia sinica]|uniref:uncharacterized protein LOC131254316 n=1 Tax=Magnolia sinica TaxID=86752 RepID=UPI00265896FF|nr:uncharacterized protein LOC131254316 [Magnolia sinica]
MLLIIISGDGGFDMRCRLSVPPSQPEIPSPMPKSYRQTHLTLSSSKPIVRFFKPNLPPIKCSNSSKKIRSPSREQHNPFQAILDAIFKTLKSLQKPAIATVLLGVLLVYDPHSALAASGGRMGGQAFSSSLSSRSYSVPSSNQLGFSYSVLYYAPTPFGGSRGCYMGPAVGVGVGVGSSLFVLMMDFPAAILVSGFLSDQRFKLTDQMMPLFSLNIYL